jgi:transcriptional regulator with XRE-family HTH domain
VKHRTQLILRRLGRNLAHARHESGLTQEQVATRMDVTVTQYARMERGEHDSGVSRYLDAAWAIGMPPGNLFRRLERRMP